MFEDAELGHAIDKATYEARVPALRSELLDAQFALKDQKAFPVLLLLNPADIFRILNVFSLEEVKTLYGLATVFPETLANPWLLGTTMLLWIAAPLALAYYRFRH